MSAAAVPHLETGPGWPELDPAGFAKLQHTMSLRGGRVTGSGPEFQVCVLLLTATIGVQKEWEVIKVRWFAYWIHRDVRTAFIALKHAEEHGFITRERVGRLCRWKLNAAYFETAPEIPKQEETGPRPVETLPVHQVPRTRLVQAQEENIRTSEGVLLTRYADGRLLVAEDEDTSTVATCGACNTTGIFRMVPAIDLQLPVDGLGEEKVKDDENVTFGLSTGKEAAPAPSPPEAPTPKPPGKPEFVDARHKAVHAYLCKYKPAFRMNAPSHIQSLAVAQALGDAPISYFDRVLRNKGYEYFQKTAQAYAIFVVFAKEAQQLYIHEVGELCPGCIAARRPEQRLRPGDQCAQCGPPVTSATRAEPRDDPHWGPVKVKLQELLPPTQFDNWVNLTSTDSVSADAASSPSCRRLRLCVRVPNLQTRHELQNQYGEQVAAALESVHGDRYSQIEYVIQQE